MPDPDACLAAAHSVLKKDGRMVLACWAAPERNPFVGLLMQVLSNYMELPNPPPGTPGIFSFADPDRLRAVMSSAGFRNIKLEEVVMDVVEVEDGRAYWEVMSDLAAPVMALVRQLEESARDDFIREVIDKADALKTGETLRMKGTTWIASAER